MDVNQFYRSLFQDTCLCRLAVFRSDGPITRFGNFVRVINGGRSNLLRLELWNRRFVLRLCTGREVRDKGDLVRRRRLEVVNRHANRASALLRASQRFTSRLILMTLRSCRLRTFRHPLLPLLFLCSLRFRSRDCVVRRQTVKRRPGVLRRRDRLFSSSARRFFVDSIEGVSPIGSRFTQNQFCRSISTARRD